MHFNRLCRSLAFISISWGFLGVLVHAETFRYVGSFRTDETEVEAFSFSAGPLAFRPSKGTLFLGNFENKVAEVSIPTPAVLTSADGIGGLPVVTILQPLADPAEGQFNPAGDDGTLPSVLGGLVVLPDDSLHGAGYLYYDANNTVVASHFRRASDLKAKSFSGWFPVGLVSLQGFVGQVIVPVPTAWQGRLGGAYLATGGALNIISRTSAGPSATVFDATRGNGTTPVQGTMLLGYDESHQTLGGYDGNPRPNPAYNMATTIGGAFIVGDSLFFVGSTGLGVACYGSGTSDPRLTGTLAPDSDDDHYCYDPLNGNKGGHAWPYAYWTWAYDLRDLAAVKAGTKQPWDVVPYQMAPIALPLPMYGDGLATAFDSATKRLFILQPWADSGESDYYAGPVIHVFTLQ